MCVNVPAGTPWAPSCAAWVPTSIFNLVSLAHELSDAFDSITNGQQTPKNEMSTMTSQVCVARQSEDLAKITALLKPPQPHHWRCLKQHHYHHHHRRCLAAWFPGTTHEDLSAKSSKQCPKQSWLRVQTEYVYGRAGPSSHPFLHRPTWLQSSWAQWLRGRCFMKIVSTCTNLRCCGNFHIDMSPNCTSPQLTLIEQMTH